MSSNTDDVESDSESPSSEGPDRGHVRGTRGRRHGNRERSKSKKWFYEKWLRGKFVKYYTLAITAAALFLSYYIGAVYNINFNVYKNDYSTTPKTEGNKRAILEDAEEAEFVQHPGNSILDINSSDCETQFCRKNSQRGKLTNDKTEQTEDSLKAVNEIKWKIRKILTVSVSDASGEEKDLQNKVARLMLYIISETNPDVKSLMITTLSRIVSRKSETASTAEPETPPSIEFEARPDRTIVNVFFETLMEGTQQDKESESLAIEADSDIVELKITNFLSSLVSQETNPIAKRKLSEVLSMMVDEIEEETKSLTLDLVNARRAISSSGKLDDSVINTLITKYSIRVKKVLMSYFEEQVAGFGSKPITMIFKKK
jgi:hypothetical protein